MSEIRIGVVGAGYWGPKLIRNFANSRTSRSPRSPTKNPAALRGAASLAPEADLYADGMELIDSNKVDAVVIATPVAMHAKFGLHALAAGKHIWVEKPICASVAEAEALANLGASKTSRSLLITPSSSPAPYKTSRPGSKAASSARSPITISLRVNLGLFQPDVNVVWDLAPYYAKAYHVKYGLPVVVVRPFNAYGPREHMVGDLAEVIPRFVIRVQNGLPPIISTLDQAREQLHLLREASPLSISRRRPHRAEITSRVRP